MTDTALPYDALIGYDAAIGYDGTLQEPIMRTGVWPYVWQDPPAPRALDSYQGALVRAANGGSTVNNQGFDFAANYHAWVDKFGPRRVQPWTYLYPQSDGTRAANTLHGVAGDCDIYQCDLEDPVPPATIRAFCDRLHVLVPGCLLVFDSYPTRAQFTRVNGTAGAATWDQAVESFDVFCPQVYYSSQADDGWEHEFGGKPIWPAFSPANWADWGYFQAGLDRFGVVNLWRYPMTDDWKGKLIGGTMSATGPASWDDADWKALDDNRLIRLAQWIAGKTNSKYNATTVGVAAPPFATLRDDIATLGDKADAHATALADLTAAVNTLPQADAETLAALLAGKLEIEGITTDPATGIVSVNFRGRSA